MKLLNEHLERYLARGCAILMCLMVIDVTWQVLSRFLLEKPSSFSEELARFLLVWIGFFGAAYAYRKYAHLGLDIFTSKLEGRSRVSVDKLGDWVSLIFVSVVMIFGGFKIMLLTLELNQLSAALQIPMGYVYSVVPISGVLIAIFSIERILYGRPEPDHSLPID